MTKNIWLVLVFCEATHHRNCFPLLLLHPGSTASRGKTSISQRMRLWVHQRDKLGTLAEARQDQTLCLSCTSKTKPAAPLLICDGASLPGPTLVLPRASSPLTISPTSATPTSSQAPPPGDDEERVNVTITVKATGPQ